MKRLCWLIVHHVGYALERALDALTPPQKRDEEL
jgi:hypothetical protein